MSRKVTVEVMPDTGGFRKHSEHCIEVFNLSYTMLERKRRAALKLGQVETGGDCRRPD